MAGKCGRTDFNCAILFVTLNFSNITQIVLASETRAHQLLLTEKKVAFSFLPQYNMSSFYNVIPNLDCEAPLRQYSVQHCPAMHTGCVPSADQCWTARVARPVKSHSN